MGGTGPAQLKISKEGARSEREQRVHPKSTLRKEAMKRPYRPFQYRLKTWRKIKWVDSSGENEKRGGPQGELALGQSGLLRFGSEPPEIESE